MVALNRRIILKGKLLLLIAIVNIIENVNFSEAEKQKKQKKKKTVVDSPIFEGKRGTRTISYSFPRVKVPRSRVLFQVRIQI